MDLRRYFQPVRGDALPDPMGPLSATILRQAIAEAKKRVLEAAITKASKKRGSYGHFDVKTRAAIGKYSCENGVVAAAITTSFATAAQSCLHSPLPRSRVFTRHCRAVVSSLATAAQSCLHSPLLRSRVFTRHCRAVVS